MARRKAKRKTRSSTTDSLDPSCPVDAYALAVTSGEVVAGPHVRDACARHLRDRKHGPARGLRWDRGDSDRAIAFFALKLRVDVTAADGAADDETKPFELLDWQAFIVGSLFGWKGSDGTRRFRMAFIETGKGSGKSPLAAGIGLYMMTADGEHRAEIYAAATKKDQAKVLFRDAIAMVEMSPDLDRRLALSGGAEKTNIAYIPKGSFFRPISTEDRGKGQSGPRPHCGLLDEIHEHPTNAMVEMMRAGTKGRRQALIFMITNSGSDKTSVCYSYHDYGSKVCSGAQEDDSFFAYICALDEGEDPFEDQACWPKANPSLGKTFTEKYLSEQVTHARGMPSKANMVRRLNFCEWTDADSPWITHNVWIKVERDLRLDDLRGRPCVLGLDMSYTTDPSALAAVFPEDGDRFAAVVEFFLPRVGIREKSDRDHVDYQRWADEGHLHLTDGRVIKLAPIADRLRWFAEHCDLRVVVYDRYRHRELADNLADLGLDLPMIEHPQGFRRGGVLRDDDGDPILDDEGRQQENPLWMPDSVQKLENAIVEDRCAIGVNPMLRWNVASVVVRDDPAGTGNRIFDKRRATGRIDGAVALAMAAGASIHFGPGVRFGFEIEYEPGQMFA